MMRYELPRLNRAVGIIIVLIGSAILSSGTSYSQSSPQGAVRTTDNLRDIAGEVMVTSFERAVDGRSWTGGERVNRCASKGDWSLRIAPGETAVWKLDGDWSAYRHLKLDVFNPGSVVLANFRFFDNRGQGISAFEYNLYSGHSTQHIRIDGLANDFGIGAGIDVAQIARMEVCLGQRWRHDLETDGVYIDNLRLSNRPTEPYRQHRDGPQGADPSMAKPPGFLLPEFPGFEAGYHTFAIDSAGYQLLARPGTGRQGHGRALELKPLSVDDIKLWDTARRFPEAGTYVMECWIKGPDGARFVDHSAGKTMALSPQWRKHSYEFDMPAGGRRRFVLEVQNLQGQSAWLDDFVVYLKDGRGPLETVSQATGDPATVTYADGVCYINGAPTFMLGFLRGEPEKLRGTPFNFCAPHELLQPDMAFLDRCAEYGLWTSVNLTATLRAIAPDNAVYFARKYKDHPALFSYYLCDEPDHASPSATSEAPVLARATQQLAQVDPNHPTQALIIPWCASNIYRYRDTVDILSADRYAVQGTPDNSELWTVYRANVAMKQSATDGQVNIFTPLARPDITRQENWAQAYMCVAAGAGGILWFHFDGAQPKWNDFLELGRELRCIEEFLVGVALERGLIFENDVLPEFQSGKTVHRNFHQIRGIGRAGSRRTALITVNITPHQTGSIRITAPFMAHAQEAKVMFENRTVPIVEGVIIDRYAGLERHVYVADGLPEGVKPRPIPQVNGPHITHAGAAWQQQAVKSRRGRSPAELQRDRFMRAEIRRADELLAQSHKEAALKVLRQILQRYPDAQDIRERIRAIR